MSPPPSKPIKSFSALKSLRKEWKKQADLCQQEAAKHEQKHHAELNEATLFRSSIGSLSPIKPTGKIVLAARPPLPIARQHLADEKAALSESLSDEFTIESLLETDETLSYRKNGIGHDVLRKLRRGYWVIQDQLDLHGMRTDEAREACSAFLQTAARRGVRCVRIIHGKGLGSVNREPVLKKKVLNWLVQKETVIAFCQAKAADGGSGAVIVLLKADKKV